MFDDDLPQAIETLGCTIVLYSDDLSVAVEGKTAEEVIEKGNICLAKLKEWAHRNYLVV